MNANDLRLTQQLLAWRQGDTLSGVRFRHVARRDLPLSQASKRIAPDLLAAAPSDEIIVTTEPQALVIVSQTCDIVRVPEQLPFIDVCAVVELSSDISSDARRGRRPRYAPLPALGDAAFADLCQTMSVEKSVLLDLEPRHGVLTIVDQRTFARALARYRARFAFPDAFTDGVDALRRHLQSLASKQTPEAQLEGMVRSIRAEPLGSVGWEAEHVEVRLYFVVDEEALPLGYEILPAPALPADLQQLCAVLCETVEHQTSSQRGAVLNLGWQRLADHWRSKARVGSTADPKQTVQIVEAVAISESEMTVAQYVRSEQLDFDHLSEPSPGSAPSAL